MEKITREQVNSIEGALRNNEWSKDDLIRIHVKNYNTGYESWGAPWESLNKLDVAKMARALYIGYEVEEEFKAKDWVVSTGRKQIAQVAFVQENQIWAYWDEGDDQMTWLSVLNVRHATPEEIAQEKERRWWKKIGREVNEFKIDDIVINTTHGTPKPFAIESDINLNINASNKHLKLVCPVENRLDSDSND